MKIDHVKLLEVIRRNFDYQELITLSALLDVDFDWLRGESTASKARELIAHMERCNQLDKLVEQIQCQRPDLDVYERIRFQPDERKAEPTSDASMLSIELASLRQQLEEIQRESLSSEQLEHHLQKMLRTASRAVGRSEELTARVILPRREAIDVRLVPSHSLERLEEYRADENMACLLIGTFGGAILGIVSNWTTSHLPVVTQSSVALLILLAVLTLACILWARRLRHRAEMVKMCMFSQASSAKESDCWLTDKT